MAGVYSWQIIASHREAKVTLTVRDPERRYDSARDTIYAATHARNATPAARLLCRLVAWPNQGGARVPNGEGDGLGRHPGREIRGPWRGHPYFRGAHPRGHGNGPSG